MTPGNQGIFSEGPKHKEKKGQGGASQNGGAYSRAKRQRLTLQHKAWRHKKSKTEARMPWLAQAQGQRRASNVEKKTGLSGGAWDVKQKRPI